MKKSKAKTVLENSDATSTGPEEMTVSEVSGKGHEVKPAPHPSHADIETVAYLKYLDGGRKDGDHLKHWLEAERQLSEE